jgi:DNA-binding MarR family transcriptional regulator
MDPDSAERLRRVVAKLARQLNAASTAEGLTPTQASVLGIVAGRGPMGLPDIIAVEGLNPTMLSRVLGTLEQRGLVVRKADLDDLRAVSVTATKGGHDLHRRLRAGRVRSVARLVAQLEPEQQDRLSEALPVLEGLVEVMNRDQGRAG